MAVFPDVVARKKVKGAVTVSGVPAGGVKKHTVVLKENYLIIGVPKVSTPTADAEVELVNGGDSEFTVKVINNAPASKDVVVEYEVNVLVGA